MVLAGTTDFRVKGMPGSSILFISKINHVTENVFDDSLMQTQRLTIEFPFMLACTHMYVLHIQARMIVSHLHIFQ